MTSITSDSILLSMIIILSIILVCQSPCTLNDPNCSDRCKDKNCNYNAVNNYFYNNSVDNSTGYHGPFCCDGCVDGYFQWPDNKTCASFCPVITGGAVKTYGVQDHNQCVDRCPYNTFGNNLTTMCVELCPTNSFAHRDNNICVSECYGEYYIKNQQNKSCDSPYQESDKSSDIGLVVIEVAAAILVIVLSVLFYKYYCKKRLIRKPWKYDMVKDIQFSV